MKTVATTPIQPLRRSRVLPARLSRLALAGLVLLAGPALAADDSPRPNLDRAVRAVLQEAGFTGTVGSSIEQRLGRPIDRDLADLGRLL